MIAKLSVLMDLYNLNGHIVAATSIVGQLNQ
jgi:hypothetical protein